jgi:hypothetical protein
VPRFPIYTDADVNGPYVEGLKRNGWDVMRAVDEYPEGTVDSIHFERAEREGRVIVGNDVHLIVRAVEWISAGRVFPGLVTWRKRDEGRMSVGHVLRAFEELAAKESPFRPYPIVYLKTKD